VAARLELSGRVQVERARAELAGRNLSLRGRFDLVVARSFGPPAVTAECAAPFLRPGGQLVVTEPPDGPTDRWPAPGLDLVGLLLTDRGVDPGWVAFSQTRPCPPRYPRPVGQPAKRPLWSTGTP
jgi:16S rRNA (guanine527-N7)-methyltransferase